LAFLRARPLLHHGRECPDALSPEDLGDHSYFDYLEVDDVDALHRDFVANDVPVIKELRSEPWGMRELGIRTIDGHRMMFGAPAPPDQY